jgi:uncharacterized protein YuzE
MRITYDSEADAVYIRFNDSHPQVMTEHLSDDIAADYDEGGRLAGLEILDASKLLGGKGVFDRIVFEDITRRRD